MKPSVYHHAFVVLPFSVEVDDSEVYGPDEGGVQHGVVRSATFENHLLANCSLGVLRGLCDDGCL